MIKIEEKKEGDLPALRELFLKVRQSTFIHAPASSFRPEDFDSHTLGEYILIAVYENMVVGFISAWLQDNFIHHLYIDENHQGKGIGTELLKAIMEKINSPVTLKCLESNVKAIAFYEKRNFVKKGKGHTKDGPYLIFESVKKKD